MQKKLLSEISLKHMSTWHNNIVFKERIINNGNTKLLCYSRAKEQFISRIIEKINNMI
jgi:hypothetical protein